MTPQLRAQPLRWYAIGRSVRGASHIRSGLCNQDAIRWVPESGSGPPLVLAVSDGHGSAKSFRSHIGSAAAVTLAVELMQELVDVALPNQTQLSAIKRAAEERLPQELVRRWQQAIDTHMAENPFTDEELDAVLEARSAPERDDVLSQPRLAYGATVLGALIASDFVLYLQLGDGDVLAVGDKGEVVRPLPKDARLIANETTSLCMDQAWREVRVGFQAGYGTMPALVMVSTDGYANSFVDDAAFLQVGSDILDILREEGVATVTENLEGWLREASEAGSGDDITLGILYREDIVNTSTLNNSARSESEAPTSEEVPDSEEKSGASTPVSETRAKRTPSQASASRIERSLIVAQIKHEGPCEPAKQGRLLDLVERPREGADDAVDAGADDTPDDSV